ncbi:acyltransferase family protein [Legionella shakespearei]|uniref:Acyltransferase n=1 Tax=Legionella shakespearei DSM 23087 TaxID=1122169 RepID=A0A0W0YL45_9GAMM|nr:acyltransferase family protein [Legionella shakespearei]KTD57559.1 acyltransferase [Legionella shakespearei DSM 23087]
MTYRPHVDGLRAIAILFVLFFHAGLKTFPSGFVGVDVFFVISGFLITGIIYESLQNNRFSFARFYSRRLWRLQPVFICLLVVTTLITFLFYLPDDLLGFSKSARKTSLFISNQFFEKVTTGYFATDSNQLPLLHTWSLSIEWQCYLILPIALYLLHRMLGKDKIVKVIYFLTLLFIALSFYLSIYHTEQTYYLFFSRIFEFLIGSCVALTPLRFPSNKYVINLISFTALLTLFFLATRSDISSGFPNQYALILCLATGILIASGEPEYKPIWIRLLSSKPVVFTGLLSYSLYIWHWPVFALNHYLGLEETTLRLALNFVIVFIVAYLSWRFIEKPARSLSQTKAVYTLILLFALPVALFHLSAFTITHYEGFPQRFVESARITKQLKQYDSPQRPLCLQVANTEVSNACMLGSSKPNSQKGFMIGDSFSNHYWRFLEVLAEKANTSVLAHATGSCLTLPSIAQYHWFNKKGIYEECFEQTKRYYDMIKSNHYDYVIIGESWNGYLDDRIVNNLNDPRSYELTKQRIETALDEALQTIIDSGAKPVLIKTIALAPKGDPYVCFYNHIKQRKDYSPDQCDFDLQPERYQWIDGLFARMQAKYSQLIIIDPQSVQCPNGRCRADINQIPTFRDRAHLTDYASYHLGKFYLQSNKNPLIG